MTKAWLASACLGLSMALGVVACGDDDEEDTTAKVDVPGAEVSVKSLSAAGSGAEQ